MFKFKSEIFMDFFLYLKFIFKYVLKFQVDIYFVSDLNFVEYCSLLKKIRDILFFVIFFLKIVNVINVW